MARQKGAAGLRGVAREIFAGLARSYEGTLDVATLFQDRRWKDWVLEETRKGKGESFLDVGCGTLLLEEDRRTSGFAVVGVDLSRDMLGMAKTKALSNVRLLVEGDAETLPFPDCSFDCVVSLYVIKYVSRSLFIQELARVAKPGGKVVFYDFARPAGLFAPVLGFYIYGVLRLAGALLGLAGREEAVTFRMLPGVIRNATWDIGLEDTMKASGFARIRVKTFAGGAAYACAAMKNPH